MPDPTPDRPTGCGPRSRALLLLAGIGAVAGCGGPLSTLDPGGPGAQSIALLWWVMLAGAFVILAGVMALALYAFREDRRGRGGSGRAWLIGGGLVFPLVTLLALLVYALRSGEALLPRPEAELLVEARGHQWWWEFVYPDVGGGPLYTAGVLHVPAGRPFHVRVIGEDVIHSFWIPRLGGKIDAIPGQLNLIGLQAERPGLYRGQCAEFCGAQHAHMDFVLEAHPEDALRARLMSLAAPPPADGPGAADFARHCSGCHSVDARRRSISGPSLAGLGERRWFGGGAMPNAGADDLRRWLRQHERVKPGSRKPPHDDLDETTLERIVTFLATLR
jgi:cytochrome c oxidase subunit 2